MSIDNEARQEINSIADLLREGFTRLGIINQQTPDLFSATNGKMEDAYHSLRGCLDHLTDGMGIINKNTP